MKPITEESALSRLANLCARAEYCIQDMRKKMSAWELSEEAQTRIIARLLKDRYIDENRYAHAFVRSKFRFNRWGRDKIRQALRLKGISDDDIADGLSEIQSEESDTMLKELLRKKSRTIKYNSDYERYMKLLRFAVSRGFSLDDARKAIESMEG